MLRSGWLKSNESRRGDNTAKMIEPIRATKKMVEEVFDGAAAHYDRIGTPLFEWAGARLVELVGVSKNVNILDIGTGAGAVLIPAAQRGANVTGIDLADGMLRSVEQVARERQLTNYHLFKMDAEHLEFPDSSFDAVTCAFALFLCPSMRAALGEMQRVLKTDGRIGVTVWGPAPFDPAWKILSEQIRAYGIEVRMPNKVSYSEEEIRALLETAGFAAVETRLEPINAVYPSEEDWWQFQFTTGARIALLRMPNEIRKKFRDEYLAKLRHLFRADGLHLPAPVMYVTATK